MKVRECFNKLVEELKSNSNIEIERLVLGDPMDSDLKEIILDRIDFKLPDSFLNFYNQIASIKIEWKCDLAKNKMIVPYSKEEEQIYGEINILPLGTMVMFDEKLLSEYWTGNIDPEELEDVKNFRYFNKHDEYLRLGFLVENNMLSDEMYYIQEGTTGFAKAPFSFKEYLEAIFKYKGFLGFEYNMLYPETESNERMKHYIKEIFGE